MREELDKRESMLHNFISSTKQRRSSQDTSKSWERRSPTISSLIPSPQETKHRRAKLIEKVNKEEGVTFRPKLNKYSNRILAEKNMNLINCFNEYNSNDGDIFSKQRLSQDLVFENMIDYEYPSFSQYKNLALPRNLSDVPSTFNTRYDNIKTLSNLTSDNEDDIENRVPIEHVNIPLFLEF